MVRVVHKTGIVCLAVVGLVVALVVNVCFVKNARSTHHCFYTDPSFATDALGIQYRIWISPTLKLRGFPLLYLRGLSTSPFNVGIEVRGESIPYDSVEVKRVTVVAGDEASRDIPVDNSRIGFVDRSTRQAWQPQVCHDIPIDFADGRLIQIEAHIVLSPGDVERHITSTLRCATRREQTTLFEFYAKQ